MILDWKKFVLRSDIRNLPLEEQRKKFLSEQLYQDNLLSEQKQRQYEFYMSQMQSKGGSGGSTSSGLASDGPISGATVTSNLGTTTTNNLGVFTFPGTLSGEITVLGGTDSITGLPFIGELKGFSQYSTISPATTLAYYLKEEDASLTTDTAIDLIFASSSTLFGIELGVIDKDVMLNQDYIETSIINDNQKSISAQSIATYLESITSMVGSAVKGADELNFTNNNAKIEGYKSIARQISNTEGAKNEINPTTLFDEVKLPNGEAWTSTGSLNRTNRETITTQLVNVRNQLGTLSRSEAFTSNYLTTQIQSINRGVKEDYAVEANKLAKGQSVTFDDMDTMIGKSTGSLAQIESGKSNENTRSEGEKPETFYTFGPMAFTQTFELTTKTLSGPMVEGNMKAISTSTELFTPSDGLNRYLLNSINEAINFQGATNYNARLDIVAKQNTPSPENVSANKVWQITLNARNFQIKDVALVDAPSSGEHIFGTGTYTLSMAGSRVTQVLTISERSPYRLSFGGNPGLNMDSINIAADLVDATKFVVQFNRSIVTPSGGTAFSSNGDRSTLTFSAGANNYTVSYSI